MAQGTFDKDILDADVSFDEKSVCGDAYYGPTFAQLSAWSYGLYQITNYFCNILQSKIPAMSRLDGIAQADRLLVAWRDGIPAAFRPDSVIVVAPDRFTHLLLLHLDYANLFRAIHLAAITMRPALGNNLDKLPRRLQASEVLCVEAARSFIRGLIR